MATIPPSWSLGMKGASTRTTCITTTDMASSCPGNGHAGPNQPAHPCSACLGADACDQGPGAAVLHAAKHGHVPCLKALLQGHPEHILAADAIGCTALLWAASRGHTG